MVSLYPPALAGKNGLMLNVEANVTVGSEDSVATVWVVEYVFPLTPDFNISALVLGHYNGTTEVRRVKYVFYINASGAYLLYEGSGNGSPAVFYDDGLRSWYLGFDFGEKNPALKAFFGSMGCTINESNLKSAYLAFNSSHIEYVSKPSRLASTSGIQTEAINKGNFFLANFTISYVDPAYGANWADYSWKIPVGWINERLGMNLTSITVAAPNLINCSKGELEGEEYCFPIDPKVIYLYPDNFQIFMLPENGRLRYVVTHSQVGKKTYSILLNTTDIREVPPYEVFQYNLEKNTTRAFSLLRFSGASPYIKLEDSVGPFNPTPMKRPVTTPCTSRPLGNELWVGLIGVCIGLVLGIVLTRKMAQ